MSIGVDAESLAGSWMIHVLDTFCLNLLSLYTLIYRGIITKCAAKWPHNNVGGPFRAANCHIYQTDIHTCGTHTQDIYDNWHLPMLAVVALTQLLSCQNLLQGNRTSKIIMNTVFYRVIISLIYTFSENYRAF